MPEHLLIVDDEKNTRQGLLSAFEDQYVVTLASSAKEACELLDQQVFDIILTDLRMGSGSGMEVVERALQLPNKPICIMMTAYGSVETAVEAMRRGAFDFLTKPINLGKLEILLQRALKSRNLEVENNQLHARLESEYRRPEALIGHSAAIERCIEQVKQVAPTKATVLLYGETGTGKELFAQMLHQNSPRARKPFIAVHCAALNTNLLESELFGHEKGAFTGADSRHIGRFEAADQGTVFLDEMGEVDLSTQVKLLRFLETKTFERLGNTESLKVDVRLITATNRSLEEMVKAGKFREDLLYRLNVVTIHLPSLRERLEDVPLLLKHYLNFFAKDNGVKAPTLSAEALRALERYSWPGNIRQLRNVCENLVVMQHGQNISLEGLEGSLGKAWLESSASSFVVNSGTQKSQIKKALEASGGNRRRAAKMLGISRRTLYRHLDSDK